MRMVGGDFFNYKEVEVIRPAIGDRPKELGPSGGFLAGDIFTIMLFKKDEVIDPTPNPEGSIFEDGTPITESILGTYKCSILEVLLEITLLLSEEDVILLIV